jgi:hypothetical protein
MCRLLRDHTAGSRGGGFAGKIGEQVYLNEALPTLDLRGEVVLVRKEGYSAGFSFGGGALGLCLPWGLFGRLQGESAFGSFPYVTPFADLGASCYWD